jgi:hypothetical protein
VSSSKALLRSLSCGWIALAAVSGCAVHRVGMIERDGSRVSLVTPDGGEERLVLLGDADALRGLKDHLVEVDGRKGFGKITVGSFRAVEGPHGLPVWLGPVQRLGVQIGIADPESGELLVVDDRAAQQLQRWLGDRVAVEAYVDGPLHLHVMYWVLVDPPPQE